MRQIDRSPYPLFGWFGPLLFAYVRVHESGCSPSPGSAAAPYVAKQVLPTVSKGHKRSFLTHFALHGLPSRSCRSRPHRKWATTVGGNNVSFSVPSDRLCHTSGRGQIWVRADLDALAA